jgi:hypothetical protein
MKATDEEIEELLKQMEKVGIKGILVTGKEKEYSKKTREAGK